MISCMKRFVSQLAINGSGTDYDWSAQKVRDSRCLASKANTPDSVEAAEQGANGNGEGTDDETNQSDVEEEESIRAPQTSTKSQYELTRETGSYHLHHVLLSCTTQNLDQLPGMK